MTATLAFAAGAVAICISFGIGYSIGSSHGKAWRGANSDKADTPSLTPSIPLQSVDESTWTPPQGERRQNLLAFAQKESPSLWQTLQEIEGVIEDQNSKIMRLQDALVEFGRKPDADQDYRDICKKRDAMADSRNAIIGKLENAFVSETFKSKADFSRNVVADCLSEAVAVIDRYKTMMRSHKDGDQGGKE